MAGSNIKKNKKIICVHQTEGVLNAQASLQLLLLKLVFHGPVFFSLKLSEREQIKFWRIGVLIRDSFSSQVLKVCNLSQVEARY